MGKQTQDEMLLCSNELFVANIEARPWASVELSQQLLRFLLR